MTYYIVRRALATLSRLCKQQCSGKREAGYAVEWCQLFAFHDGPCEAYEHDVFVNGNYSPTGVKL